MRAHENLIIYVSAILVVGPKCFSNSDKLLLGALSNALDPIILKLYIRKYILQEGITCLIIGPHKLKSVTATLSLVSSGDISGVEMPTSYSIKHQ